MNKSLLIKLTFCLIILACLIPGVTPAMSLGCGIAFSLISGNPFPAATSKWSKILLQISIIALGFGLPLSQVLLQAKEALPITITGISLTVIVGLLLGRLFSVEKKVTTLIAFGTAICGGSAIAAMAPAIKAEDEDVAVSLATVFSLNALALIIFPVIGRVLTLSQQSFGVWAGLAIHDTSSVVGAASNYGAAALAVATTVKLARAIWITPCVLTAGFLTSSKERPSFPLFIIGFLFAAMIRSSIPTEKAAWEMLAASGRQLLVATLFLVGAGLTRQVLSKVGIRPMVLGLLLWIIVSSLTLIAINNHFI